MSNSLRQENAPSGADKNSGGQSTLGTQAVPWKDMHTVDLNVQRDVTIEGNLTVSGATSTVEVVELHTEEPMVRIAKVNVADATDIGLYGATNTDSDGTANASTRYHGFIRDADDSKWKLFEGNTSSESSGTITLDAGTEGTLKAKIDLPAAGDLKIGNIAVDADAAEMNVLTDATAGSAVAEKALVVDSSRDIDNLNNVTATQVTAAFVGNLTGKADTADALETARTIQISGDSAGSASFDGSGNIDIATTIQADAIENSMILNPGYSFGDGTTPELRELGTPIVIQGTDNEVEVARVDGTFTVGLPSTISGLTSVSSAGFTGGLTGKADTADALETARNISISGDVAGSVSFDGSANVDISATIQTGSVENSMLANSGLSVSVDGGAVDVVNLGEALKFASGTDIDVTYNSTTNEVAVALEAEIGSDTTGNAATASALETARTLSLSGDLGGSVSFDGSSNADIDATIQAGSVDNSMLANSGITVQDDHAQAKSLALGGSLRFSETSNETTVNYDTSSDTVTIGLPSTITADVTGNADTATALATARNFGISGGPVQATNISFDGTGNVSLTSTIADNQITNSMLANDKLIIQIDDIDYDRALGSTLKFAGTDLDLSYSAVANEITYALPASISSDTSGNAGTATTLETARSIGITSGPVIAANVSFDGSGAVALTSSIADESITNDMLVADAITFAGDSGSQALQLGDTFTISGSLNEIVSAVSGDGITLSLPDNVSGLTSVSATSLVGALTGNSSTATKLATAREFSITAGPVRAIAVGFDGAGDVALTTTIADSQITNDMLSGSIADSKLSQITTTDKVALSALAINDATETATLADTDVFVIKDANGGNNKLQASSLQTYSRNSFSVIDAGGDGSLSYAAGTGVITYTGPSASEVRAHVSGGTGVTITDGSIAIGQAVATDSNVDFNTVTINSVEIDSTDAAKIDDITNGTAAANKALVVDINKDIAGIRNLLATQLSDGTATLTGGDLTASNVITSTVYPATGDLILTATGSNKITIAKDLNCEGKIIGGDDGVAFQGSMTLDTDDHVIISTGNKTLPAPTAGREMVYINNSDSQITISVLNAALHDIYSSGSSLNDLDVPARSTSRLIAANASLWYVV